MTDPTVYTVSFTSVDKMSSAEVDIKIYNLLYNKNYHFIEHFQDIDEMVLIKIIKNGSIYYWKTTNKISEILKEEYSIDILE